jgi:D-amino-acid oxidase
VSAWAIASYRRFAALAQLPETGVLMREALEVFPAPMPDPTWAGLVEGFRHARPEELPPARAHGIVFVAPVIDMSIYLPWLLARVRSRGVELLERRLASLAPALAAAPIVINTSGLGARELAQDPRVYPVRGQVLRRAQVGLARVLLDEHDSGGITYVVPRGHDVILGGVAEEHVEDMLENPAQSRAIAERCELLEPRLHAAAGLGVRVGLRPCRDVVRLEAEWPTLDSGQRGLLVHDYGHGGAGVTLSWGCAEEVLALVSADFAS